MSTASLIHLLALSALWGGSFLFLQIGAPVLDEIVGWHTLAGSIIVLLGTALVTGFTLHALIVKKADANV